MKMCIFRYTFIHCKAQLYTFKKEYYKSIFLTDIDCNNTVKGGVGNDLTIYCVIGNTDDDYLTNITIYKGQSLFLEASGDQGTKETTDQTASVTYTSTTISFTVFKLGCAQSTIYRFVVNNLLEDSVTVKANSKYCCCCCIVVLRPR